MSIVLMLNLKGGVAKTTNCVAIAEGLADSGYRVLVVDADHQCMASELLAGEATLLKREGKKRTLHDLLGAMLEPKFNEGELPNYIVNQVSNIGDGYPNLDLLPCSIRIDDFYTTINDARRRYKSTERFNHALERMRRTLTHYFREEYDYVLVDCPPSLALQVQQFLLMGDAFIIPSIPDRLSVRGSLWLMDRLRRKRITRIHPLGTLWSLYREQVALHREIVELADRSEEARDGLPRPFRTIIPNAARIAESTDVEERHPHTFSSKYSPHFAEEYKHLCREVRTRLSRAGL